jgi:hypothetical protein
MQQIFWNYGVPVMEVPDMEAPEMKVHCMKAFLSNRM